MSSRRCCPKFSTDCDESLFKWLCALLPIQIQSRLRCSCPTRIAQSPEDPLLDFGDDVAFCVETRDEVPEVSQSTEVNAKRAGAG